MRVVGDLLVEFKERPLGDVELPVLTLTERNGFVRQKERFNKRLATDDTSAYKVVRRHDIAFNPYLLWAGAVAQNTIEDSGIISPLYPTFRVREGHDPRYVARLLLTPQMIAAYDGIAFGSVPRRRRSSVSDFLNLPLANVPPLDEQRRIAATLDHADALRAKRRQVLDHLDALTQSIFRDVFGDPRDWPRRWPMGLIGDLAEDVQYGTSGKAGEVGEWPILRMGNVTDRGRLDLSDLKYIDLAVTDVPKYTLRRGDLLFNRTNSKEKVGKTCVVDTDRPLALAGYLVRVRFRQAGAAHFVNGYMTSKHGVATRRRLAKAAVNQANISASEFKRIPIAHPDDASLASYESAYESVTRQREQVAAATLQDDALLASLQSRAFRGEL